MIAWTFCCNIFMFLPCKFDQPTSWLTGWISVWLCLAPRKPITWHALQIYADGYSYLFDMVEADEAARRDIVTGLAGLLQSEGIEVVMHDGRQDAAALMYQCGGIFIANIFDTQVGWPRARCSDLVRASEASAIPHVSIHPQCWYLFQARRHGFRHVAPSTTVK